MRFLIFILTITICFQSLELSAQDSTEVFEFDYWIETTGTDSLWNKPATITITDKSVTVRTDYEYFTRYITAKGVSMSGDSVLFFANCDKLRLSSFGGVVDGIFITNRGITKYFGIDARMREDRGWIKKTINNQK